jgi:hypothetical protein
LSRTYFRGDMHESDPVNVAAIRSMLAAITEVFATEYPKLNVEDVHTQVLSTFHRFTNFPHLFDRQRLKITPSTTFPICGCPDVAILNPMYGDFDWHSGVLVGIELKPDIENHHFIQAQIGCLLIALNSNFPTLQVCFATFTGFIKFVLMLFF